MKLEITINGEAKIFDRPLTVNELLDHLQIPPNHIAVAINNAVISRDGFSNTAIRSGDRVEIVRPLGGG